MRIASRATERWQRFWFQEISPEIFALLRIAFGVLGLVHVAGLTPVAMLWSPTGIVSVPDLEPYIDSAFFGSPLAQAAGYALFGVLVLGFLAMIVGVRTGAAVTTCFAGSVAFAYWNPLPRYGADDVLVVVLFCLLWSDSGRCLSLDAWLAASRSGALETAGEGQPIWPLRLLQFQVALIYLNSGLWKLLGTVWRDGSAIQYALEYNLLHRFPGEIPQSLAPILVGATYVTLMWELAFAFMVFHPVSRRVALVTGLLVHGGIWILMDIGVFSWLMMASYVAFLDPESLGRRLAWARPTRLRPSASTT
jgi:hypothetical protein